MPNEEIEPFRVQARMFSRGRITIPKVVRGELGLKPGDKVEYEPIGDEKFRVRKLTADE
jgi:AbrB family looped-hinge helix DNA binding protein